MSSSNASEPPKDPTTRPGRRESAFAPNVRKSASRSRLVPTAVGVKAKRGAREDAVGTETAVEGAESAGGEAKRAEPTGEATTTTTPVRPSSRLGRSVAENAGEARKKSRLAGAASATPVGSASRLRTARATADAGGKASEARGSAGKRPVGSPGAVPPRAATPLGFRSPAPSRAAKQLVPAVARLEAKLTPQPPQPPPQPFATQLGSPVVPGIGSPVGLALVSPSPPQMAIPAHRWVRSAGSTRGGRVGDSSKRDALEATASYADDPAMTIRDIIRRKTAEEKINDAKERVMKKAAKPIPEFAAKKKAEAAAKLAAEQPPQPPLSGVKTIMAPQVQVIDGNIVINPQSLTVNASVEKKVHASEFRHVEENGNRLNAASYSRRVKAEKWSKEDTELFYRAMTQFGTDFSLIARLFPGRTRRQVKRKYLIEDRADPRRVEAAIQNRDQDPALYKNLIAVLKAQAAEAEPTKEDINARVVLDGDSKEDGSSDPEPAAPSLKKTEEAPTAKAKGKSKVPEPQPAAVPTSRSTRARK